MNRAKAGSTRVAPSARPRAVDFARLVPCEFRQAQAWPQCLLRGSGPLFEFGANGRICRALVRLGFPRGQRYTYALRTAPMPPSFRGCEVAADADLGSELLFGNRPVGGRAAQAGQAHDSGHPCEQAIVIRFVGETCRENSSHGTTRAARAASHVPPHPVDAAGQLRGKPSGDHFGRVNPVARANARKPAATTVAASNPSHAGACSA
jgi:hypothetical protein